MASLVGGAALGAVFGEVFNVLHDTVKCVGSDALMFKPIRKSLQFNLNLLAPVVEEIRQLNKKLDHTEKETKSLKEDMRKVGNLVKFPTEGPWAQGQFGPPRVGLPFTSLLRETTYKVERGHCDVLPVTGPPDFTVGMDEPLKVLKTKLLEEKKQKQQLLLTAPGGCGKTILVKMLGHDQEIKVRGCGGFPLALKVNGKSLCGKPLEAWRHRGSFREEQKIPVLALIDVWQELYKHDEDGIDAIAILHELTSRNLANLVMTRYESKVIQDICGDVHNKLCEQGTLSLKMGRLSYLVPSPPDFTVWLDVPLEVLKTQLLKEKKQQLLLTAPGGCGKTALMKRLGHDQEIKGSFAESQRIDVPSLIDIWEVLHDFDEDGNDAIDSLHELTTRNLATLVMTRDDALPNLMEINIDYCNDLVELPAMLCDVIFLKKLSITNCHQLSALPNGIGKLVNLEVLRLGSYTDLSELPESIRSFHKLCILDISDCLGIRHLPKDIGELCNLKELHMKGCLSLRKGLPQSTTNLEQLKLVICDEERAKFWEPIKEVLTNLEVKAAEKDTNLTWLLKP
uniref:RPW8 domain-containing protein n=1 Tax=Quercus lobata TaxID=97700 RepID=A0A7N2RA40_QUELO